MDCENGKEPDNSGLQRLTCSHAASHNLKKNLSSCFQIKWHSDL